ncbi:MAG: gliding motility-associated C-terminal domain-containing protein [Williamsia sp.]|nr:gliding motility-associated C-terminal domain-containing protein [Williamsia sp.]
MLNGRMILRLVLVAGLACLFKTASARHGKGGSITYEYKGAGSATGSSVYRITVKHYVDCSSANLIEASSYLGIFDAATNNLIRTVTIARTNTYTLQKNQFSPCINPVPEICFFVVEYIDNIELADNIAGYVLAEQECCRISNIVNVQNSSNYGTTNTNTIPGVISGIVYRKNTSPVYAQRDTAVICHNAQFTIDFSAVDEDGDQLTYSFCSAKAGASSQNRQPNPPSPPPYADLPYQGAYSAAAPMGSGVQIDARTGLISGVAPDATGTYVISVCVAEFRGGVQIGTTKKEVHMTVADCSLSGATLKPSYVNCADFSFDFKNENQSFNIDTWSWDFGVPSLRTDTSSKARPSYTYPDTGTFVLKLKVSTAAGCIDSATSKVIVYPGFNAGFTATGSCYQSPFLFADTTTTRYGVVDKWSWDFGDPDKTTDTSTARNASYQYTAPGSNTVSFIVSNTKGCIDTVTKTVVVSDKPFLALSFHDTLICSIDSLQLHARGSGSFSWTPASFLQNPSSPDPLVFPKDTAVYVVTLNEKGCVTSDSIRINVLDSVTVKLPADTTICLTDSIRFRPVSDALQYQWLPATGLSDPQRKNPTAAPVRNTVYQVTARLGNCQDKATILVKTIPYPQADAGRDTAVCFGDKAQLNAVIKGSSFLWTPISTLQNGNTLHPRSLSLVTTPYVLTAYDTLGCPKPGRDTVQVIVYPRVPAYAGNDTVVVPGQPLQLNASGGTQYSWTPYTALNNGTISNPVAVFPASLDSITYTVRVTRQDGCYGEDAVKVKIFKTLPEIFVPTAFTPNGDGRNDVLKPILAGIKSLTYFRVYNRWGTLVYSTQEVDKGWDGTVHGMQQKTDTFVYMAEGIDYRGGVQRRKGTVVLIR